MQNTDENTELSQKYCGHLAYNVTILHEGDDAVCLSSHLCHGENSKTCDHYSGSSSAKESRTHINEI